MPPSAWTRSRLPTFQAIIAAVAGYVLHFPARFLEDIFMGWLQDKIAEGGDMLVPSAQAFLSFLIEWITPFVLAGTLVYIAFLVARRELARRELAVLGDITSTIGAPDAPLTAPQAAPVSSVSPREPAEPEAVKGYRYLGESDMFLLEEGGNVYRPGDIVPISRELMEHMSRHGAHRFERVEGGMTSVSPRPESERSEPGRPPVRPSAHEIVQPKGRLRVSVPGPEIQEDCVQVGLLVENSADDVVSGCYAEILRFHVLDGRADQKLPPPFVRLQWSPGGKTGKLAPGNSGYVHVAAAFTRGVDDPQFKAPTPRTFWTITDKGPKFGLLPGDYLTQIRIGSEDAGIAAIPIWIHIHYGGGHDLTAWEAPASEVSAVTGPQRDDDGASPSTADVSGSRNVPGEDSAPRPAGYGLSMWTRECGSREQT